jgi:hypothetical protein
MEDDNDEVAAEAERLQRRRTRMMQASGLLFVIWMAATVAHSTSIAPGTMRLVDILRNVSMLAWGAVLLRILATGGMLPRTGKVREILEDELTLAHRRNALMSGFWVLVAAVTVIYAISLFVPIAFNEVAPVLLIAAVAVPTLRFALLERRASKDG